MLRHTVCVVLWLWLLRATAHGEELSEKEVLAKTLLAEAGEAPLVDHAAILHVLKRRQTLPRLEDHSLAEVAQAYSVFWRDPPSSAHARSIRALTWDEIPAWTKELVETFEAGALPDPCEGRAWHWGSAEDAAHRPDLEPVGCGTTANVFLGLERPRRPAPEPLPAVSTPRMEIVVIEPEIRALGQDAQEAERVSWMFVVSLVVLCGVLVHRLGDVMAENQRRKEREEQEADALEKRYGRRKSP